MPMSDEKHVAVFGSREFGAWLLEILPDGARELKKKVVVARTLLEAVRANPGTMNATFLAEGEFITDWAVAAGGDGG